MTIGAEWLVDATGCRPEALGSVPMLRALFDRIIRELDLHVMRESEFVVFPPPSGITGFVVLSESHLACHTYPEHGILTLNLYCCRPHGDWPWRERLAEIIGASEVIVRKIERRTGPEPVER